MNKIIDFEFENDSENFLIRYYLSPVLKDFALWMIRYKNKYGNDFVLDLALKDKSEQEIINKITELFLIEVKKIQNHLYTNETELNDIKLNIRGFVIIANIRQKYYGEKYAFAMPITSKGMCSSNEAYEFIHDEMKYYTISELESFLNHVKTEKDKEKKIKEENIKTLKLLFPQRFKDSNKDKIKKQAHRPLKNKKILKYDKDNNLVAEYENRKECIEKEGMAKNTLSMIISGKRKHYKNYIYKEEL